MYRRYAGALFTFFQRAWGSPWEAVDLVTECFRQLHRERLTAQPGRPLAPWIEDTSRKLLMARFRRSMQSGPHGSTSLNRDQGPGGPQQRQATEPRDQAELRTAIESLEPVDRVVLALYHLRGCSPAEMAAGLGLTEADVRLRVSRVLLGLGRGIQADG